MTDVLLCYYLLTGFQVAGRALLFGMPLMILHGQQTANDLNHLLPTPYDHHNQGIAPSLLVACSFRSFRSNVEATSPPRPSLE